MNSKDLFILSILTFLTVAVWTVYDIYHAAATSKITPVQEKLIEPLAPKLDKEVLMLLKNKKD